MRTLTCTTPGTWTYCDTTIPAIRPGFSLVRIRHIGICGTDIHAFEGTQPFFSYPRVLGHELSMEYVEGNAPGFSPGQPATLIPYLHCGICIACRQGKTNCCQQIQVMGVHTDGGMADYLLVRDDLLLDGTGLSPESLALVEPLSISAHGVGRAAVQPGEFVLVIGAGPIGVGAMEFARLAGGEVIAMDVNEMRLEFCRKIIGVPHTVNALAKDHHAQIQAITGGDMPTVVIDATGNLAAINGAFSLMAHTARYVLIGLQGQKITFSHPEFHKREGSLMSSRNATRHDFEFVLDGIRSGRINAAGMITDRLAFGEVAERFESVVRSPSVVKAIIDME